MSTSGFQPRYVYENVWLVGVPDGYTANLLIDPGFYFLRDKCSMSPLLMPLQ